MAESFAELFEEHSQGFDVEKGAVVEGTVVAVDSDWVTVNAGLKSEGVIPTSEFQKNEDGSLEIVEGDLVEVAVEAIDDGFGFTLLSREKALRAKAWAELERIHDEDETVSGLITGKVKGGFTVEIGVINAFLPGSLVDVRPVRETNHIEGKELDFKVIKLDQKRNNVVVSRRAVMESENSEEREALLEKMHEGAVLQGIVKNLTDYGAFIDLGGIDGLLHITDMAWKRVRHPSALVEVGQEVTVKVLKYDAEKQRVSLGMKQLEEDPWSLIVERYPSGAKLTGKVTNMTDYGCFVELEDGIEGLVHVSEMDWTNKNIHPSKVVSLGDEVEVMILEIDEDRRRISLGIKQCKKNPWEQFAETHNKGDKISGAIKSITDFGIFIGLPGGIDGLVHLSDISWDEPGETAVRKFKKGEEVEAVIIGIDSDRERISLGVKQLQDDPFSNFLAVNERGSIITGTVTNVDERGAELEIAEGVTGYIKVSELSREHVEKASDVLSVGDSVEGKIVNVDRKNRSLQLSVKAKEQAEEREAVDSLNQADAPSIKTVGDLIKEQLDSQ
ncbi:MAG: 30S ribosomal protein S1 [Pseudomonadota bacterium]|nr:30S ribosomal protein S1 [Pseudomonadota bacterium]